MSQNIRDVKERYEYKFTFNHDYSKFIETRNVHFDL